MKTHHEAMWHMPHKHTISGMLIGGFLIIAALIDMMLLNERFLDNRTVFILLVPGIALFLRAMRPPIGLLRTLLLMVGGILAGLVPVMLSTDNPPILWTALAFGLVGAGMLGFGFSVKPGMTG